MPTTRQRRAKSKRNRHRVPPTYTVIRQMEEELLPVQRPAGRIRRFISKLA